MVWGDDCPNFNITASRIIRLLFSFLLFFRTKVGDSTQFLLHIHIFTPPSLAPMFYFLFTFLNCLSR